VAALVFGAGAWTEGCERLSVYHGDRDKWSALNQQIPDEAGRGRAEALFQNFIEVAERERGRTIPFAAATFVLGAALLALAARGLAGKTNARSAIVQVVLAQAIVYGASWYATKDFREAEADWNLEWTIQKHKDAFPADQIEETRAMTRMTMHVLDPMWLVIRTLGSGLIVFALTRQRSRDFFEAAAGQRSET
jgi:hypothetical protein